VSKTEDAKRIVAKTIETYGALDILYNNAGILGPRGVEAADFTEEDARRLWEINFMGVFLLPASKRNPQSSGWSAPLEYELPPVDDEGRGSLDRSPAGHKVEAVRALRGRLSGRLIR
jgi:hypothetical protein